MIDQYMKDTTSHENKKISLADYESWASGFLFDALKQQKYGQSFCNQFNIHDNILFYTNQIEYADVYIKKHYVA